jgi:hypothetical protein
MVVKWTFIDPSTSDSATFEINPNDDGLPGLNKTITYQNTSAPGGRVLMMEGRDEPRQGQFSGVSLSQSQHEMFEEWFGRRNQVVMTDDLGRSFVIIITSYEPKRRWTRSHPWRHDYTVSYTIVDWV